MSTYTYCVLLLLCASHTKAYIAVHHYNIVNMCQPNHMSTSRPTHTHTL